MSCACSHHMHGAETCEGGGPRALVRETLWCVRRCGARALRRSRRGGRRRTWCACPRTSRARDTPTGSRPANGENSSVTHQGLRWDQAEWRQCTDGRDQVRANQLGADSTVLVQMTPGRTS
eukprot:816570-Pleurochrysis_carterae.AAC.2